VLTLGCAWAQRAFTLSKSCGFSVISQDESYLSFFSQPAATICKFPPIALPPSFSPPPSPVGGILLGYFTGYVFADDVGGWRSMYACAAPLALALGLGMVRAASLGRGL
jgi:hypothetical protein